MPAKTEADIVAPPPPPAPVIVIIKRKKAGHGAHHGGAWKVAYADFVTAMMALFIVLWLMSADEDVKKAVANFFNNPSGPGQLTGTAAAGLGNALTLPKDDMEKLAEKIRQALMSIPDFRKLKDNVEITVTSDGLRIELLETEAGMFFESGRAVPTATGAGLLTHLAEELGKLPNNLLIEGHTDSKPFSRNGEYSNWELSSDRANSARKLMQAHGVRPEQVVQVRGYADRQLRHAENPAAASNRRITVIVQYLTAPLDAVAAAQAAEAAEAAVKEAGKKGEAAKPGEAGKKAEPPKTGETPTAVPPAKTPPPGKK
jgi:chemotaxis protein MotB